MNSSIAKIVEEIVKHLQGQHDQQSHAGNFGRGGGDGLDEGGQNLIAVREEIRGLRSDFKDKKFTVFQMIHTIATRLEVDPDIATDLAKIILDKKSLRADLYPDAIRAPWSKNRELIPLSDSFVKFMRQDGLKRFEPFLNDD